MKFLPGRPLLAGAAGVLAATTLPACTDTGYVSGGASRPHHEIRGPYYHCHPNGVCHGVRHPSYYWHGGFDRPIPHRRYRPYYYGPLPPRARPR